MAKKKEHDTLPKSAIFYRLRDEYFNQCAHARKPYEKRRGHDEAAKRFEALYLMMIIFPLVISCESCSTKSESTFLRILMCRFFLSPSRAAIFAIALATLTGCATHSEVAQVRNEAQEALRNADKAMVLAQEANARSVHTEEMVERSFRHSMRK